MKQIRELINHMELETKVVNFDNAALSYMPRPVLNAITNYNTRRNLLGPEYDQYWETVDKSRTLLAHKIGANKDEIFFTQNTSMGLNFIAQSLNLQPGDQVILSDMEFPSNVYPWMNLQNKGIEVLFLPTKNGRVDPIALEAAISPCTKVISLSWVIAGNGSVTDIQTIGDICRRHNIRYVIDGIQGLGQLPIHVKDCSCDFFVSGFFKWMMGPDGIGFVYIKDSLLNQLGFPWLGWAGMKDQFNYSQYKIDPFDGAKRYETGNMNFSALYGLAACLEFTDGWDMEIQSRISHLSTILRTELAATKGVRLLTDGCSISGITLFTADNLDEIARLLKEEQYKFSMRGGMRVSLHFYNQEEEIYRFIEIVKRVQNQRRKSEK